MATRTTSQTGNWNSSSTWGGSAPPTSAEDAVVNHAVTITANAACLTLAINAALTLNDTFSLTIGGTVTQANATFTMGAGCALVADTTAGNFSWVMGTANTQANCKIVVNGSSGSHSTISKTGANKFFFDYAFLNTTSWDAQYCDFSGINSAGNFSIKLNLFAFITRFRHCAFDACGTIQDDAGLDGATGNICTMQDCKWTNSTARCLNAFSPNARVAITSLVRASNVVTATMTTAHKCSAGDSIRMRNPADPAFWGDFVVASISSTTVLTYAQTGSNATATVDGNSFLMRVDDNFSILRCSFDQYVRIGGWAMRHYDNYFGGGILWSSGVPSQSAYNFVRSNATIPDYSVPDRGDHIYIFYDNTAGNPHFFGPTDNCDYSYFILDYPHPNVIDEGDGFYPTGVNVRLRNCVVVESISDQNAGGDLANVTASSANCDIQHCTVLGNATIGSVGYNESSATGNAFSFVKNNIRSATTAGQAFAVYTSGPTNRAALVDQDQADYNCVHNAGAYTDAALSISYTGYHMEAPAGHPPGVHDINVDPGFPDRAACACKWAVSKGAANSGDSVATKITAVKTLLTGDPTLWRLDLLPYMIAALSPTNAALKGTASDGGDIGAFSVILIATRNRQSRMLLGV